MQDDVVSKLKKLYPNCDVRLLGSGWTSDAFEAGDKIIRIPKAGVEQYKKEIVVLDFLQGKLPVQIPHPRLIKKQDFVYAEHKKIEGCSWNISTYNNLSEKDQNLFAKDIAHFFAVLHAIPVDQVYQSISPKLLEPYPLEPFDQFKSVLKSDFSENDLKILYNFSKKSLFIKPSPVLLHKDFWEANVLVDEKHRLKGVFDWANASIGNREWDFKSLYHPVYFALLDKILTFYGQETGYKFTIGDIENLKIGDSLLCAQYFIRNPHLKNSMSDAWQKTLRNIQKALAKAKSKSGIKMPENTRS